MAARLFVPTDYPLVDLDPTSPNYGKVTSQWRRFQEGVGTALAAGAVNTILTSDGANFVWQQLKNANVDVAAAIDWTKISKAGSSLADLTTRSAADLSSGTLLLARLSGITTTQLAAAAGILLAQLAFTGTADANHFLRGDSTLATITKSVFCFGTGAIAAGATNYVGAIGNNAVEANVRMVAPVAGTLRNLYVVADAAPGAGQTFIYTVRKNGADDTITCTLSGAAATTGNDTTHTDSVAAGDTFDVKVVISAAAAAAHHAISLELATA